jgi:hypothetical protein
LVFKQLLTFLKRAVPLAKCLQTKMIFFYATVIYSAKYVSVQKQYPKIQIYNQIQIKEVDKNPM